MANKGFSCEVDLSLHLVSSLGNYECCGEYVFLTIEMFGTVHKTKPQRSYYPLIFNEVVNFKKTFWSPSTEAEVLEMLEDSPVSIELKRIDPCFFDGLLLAYYDGHARDFLFSRYPRMPCSISGHEVFMERTIDFKGTAPRIRYSSFADIQRMASPAQSSSDIMNSKKFSSSFSRQDDGYESPGPLLGSRGSGTSGSGGSRKQRPSRRAASPSGSAGNSGYYQRQTVASALRSRSPSPMLRTSNRGEYESGSVGEMDGDANDEANEELQQTRDSGLGDQGDKPPFVVRRVPDNLIGRNPALHDRSGRQRRRSRGASARSSSRHRGNASQRRQSPMRRSLSMQSRLDRAGDTAPATSAAGLGSITSYRPRAASPTLGATRIGGLSSYRPSVLTGDYYCYLCHAFHGHSHGHHCHSLHGHSLHGHSLHGHSHHDHMCGSRRCTSPYYSSPLVDYYTDKLRHLTGSSYRHGSHCNDHSCYGCW